MDTTTLNHISLCAGYGGIDLGLKRAVPSLRTIAFSEIEAFPCANLVAKMEAGLLDPAPIWTDLRTFPFAEFHGLVDIISGGFPCQPFSSAGKRGADEDPRHLFPAILDGIRAARPALVFLENVEGIISAKLAGDGWRDPAGTPVLLHVLRELERVGYRATAGVFSASEVGAPHQRKRVFILAHRDDAELRGLRRECGHGQGGGEEQAVGGRGDVWPSRPGQPQFDWEPPRVVADANRRGLEGAGSQRGGAEDVVRTGRESGQVVGNADHRRQSLSLNARSGAEAVGGGQGDAQSANCCVGNAEMLNGSGQTRGQREAQVGRTSTEWNNGKTESTLGRDSDGSPGRLGDAELFTSSDNRTDELRLLGNGVVPATAERAFLTLLRRLS